MYKKLRGRIVEKYGTFREFAAALGISRGMVSMYMTGQTQFTAKRMDEWASLLDIERSEYSEYFFV